MLIHVYNPFSYYREPSYHTYYHILLFFTDIYFPASGQAVVTGVGPSPPRSLPSIFIVHRVQQSHCSSIFLSNVPNSRSRAFRKKNCRFVRKKTSPQIYTSMHSGESERTYARLEDNLIRHRGDRLLSYYHTIILSYNHTITLSYYHTIILSHYHTIMLARATLYLTDKNAFGDLFGAAWLPIPLGVHIKKIRAARKPTTANNRWGQSRERPRATKRRGRKRDPPTVALDWCIHFKTIRFKTIVEIRPSKSACHEEQTTWN